MIGLWLQPVREAQSIGPHFNSTPGILSPMGERWAIVALLSICGICLLSVPLLLLRGVDKDRLGVMGTWTGGFYVDDAEVMRGYLQLLRTREQFRMRLGTQDQEINFEGTWTLKDERVELRALDIKFNGSSQSSGGSADLAVLDAEEVRKAYAKPITLELRGRELVGLTITLDKFQGRHKFQKGAVTPNAQEALDRIKSKR